MRAKRAPFFIRKAKFSCFFSYFFFFPARIFPVISVCGAGRGQGRGQRLKETPDIFSGLVWNGQRGVEMGLADGYGSIESVARDVIKVEKIVDFTMKESFADRLAKRFGAGVASALGFAIQGGVSLRY